MILSDCFSVPVFSIVNRTLMAQILPIITDDPGVESVLRQYGTVARR